MSDFEIAFTDEAENLPAVKEVDEGLQPHNVDEMLMEIRNQPNWRITADVEADYYDGNQLDQEIESLLASICHHGAEHVFAYPGADFSVSNGFAIHFGHNAVSGRLLDRCSN